MLKTRRDDSDVNRWLGALAAVAIAGVVLALPRLAISLHSVPARSTHVKPKPILGPHGVGSVRFGLTRKETVARVSALLGRPTSGAFVNSGCGPRFTEVEWNDLVLEFRVGIFRGYRFMKGGRASIDGKPNALSKSKHPIPDIATDRGITLGGNVGEVRTAYGRLTLVGAERWQSSNGLMFVESSRRSPPSNSAEDVKIKIGTCGAFKARVNGPVGDCGSRRTAPSARECRLDSQPEAVQ